MESMAGIFLFLLTFTTKINAELFGFHFQIKDGTTFSGEKTLWSGKTGSILSCSHLCVRHEACKIATFWVKQRTCSLLTTAHREKGHKRPQQDDAFYLEKINLPRVSLEQNTPPPLGSNQKSAVTSCQTLLKQHPTTPSGVYWINPYVGSKAKAFKAYCDMETDGGGWTLVWSYSFTNYSNFNDGSNAITPRPNWLVGAEVDVPVSTTPPLDETDYNALNFSLWKQLGRQFLIKSNINNWLVCHPESGSLVDWQEGNINCTIIDYVIVPSDRLVPSMFAPTSYGPLFSTTGLFSGAYYYFDGYTGSHWPTHDPLASNRPNQKKNVVNPHGNIFIRLE